MKIFTLLLTLLFACQSIAANASTYYFHNDQLGTPQVVTDNAQTIVWQAEASPFGETVEAVSTIEQNLRFPGQYFDKETQLHYNYFRDYDPSIGRYLQSDPIGLGGGMNTYAYVGGNPYTFADPTGEFAVMFGSMLVGALYAGLIDYALQALMHGGNLACVSYEQVAISAGLGALGGVGVANLLSQMKYLDDLVRAAKNAKITNQGVVDVLSARARQLVSNGNLVGSNPTAIRTIGTGRLRGFTAQNTSATGGTGSAQALFRTLTGRNLSSRSMDRIELDGGLEVSFRPAGKSGHPKIEIVNQSTKSLEKITFLP